MSATVGAPTPPIVLIVEDRQQALNNRIEAFADAGCTPIGVRSHDDAVRELRACPGIDLVVTDIHLAKQIDDRSGVALARYVNGRYRDVPVAGYSAYFGDDDLSAEDLEPFVFVWKKPLRAAKIDEMVRTCHARAMSHRLLRVQNAFDALEVLRRRHERIHPTPELLRDLRLEGGESTPVEAALAAAGYRLKLVEATVGGRLLQPTVVWLLACEGGVEAEVYGQPALYARAATDTAAIDEVIELMHFYRADVSDDSPEAVGPALSLTKFLRETLAEDSNRGGQHLPSDATST